MSTVDYDQQPTKVLKFDDACDRLQVSRSTMFRLMRGGHLPSFKIGRSTRFLAADVDAFIRAQRDA